jgi:hypothetical protein
MGDATKRFEITAEHVDTCHPDYLQDGHNREGEWLLFASPYGQSAEDAADELIGMMNGEAPPEDFPKDVSDDVLRAAFIEALQGVDLRPIDGSGNRIEPGEEDDSADNEFEDQPYVYVVLRWSEVEVSTECPFCEAEGWRPMTATDVTPPVSGHEKLHFCPSCGEWGEP